MNQFCEMKWIKREFSVAKTPQQNKVAKRKNITLIEAARTMLADSKLPTTFWAEAVNNACKFDGKADEGFFVGYSFNSKTFRVLNSRTRIVEETLHITFLEKKPNVAGSGPEWLFDIDTLTKSMNYKPVVKRIQTNGNAGTKESIDAGQAEKKTVPSHKYILLPLCTQNLPFSSSSKDSPDAGFKPSREEEKKDAEDQEDKDSEVPNIEEPKVNQEKDENINSINIINTVSSTVNTASIVDNVVDENTIYGCADDPNMPNLEEIDNSEDDEGVGAEADMNNLDTFMPVSPIPTTRIHKDHPFENINSTHIINIVSSTVNTASIVDNAVDENTVYRCADDLNMPNLEEIDNSEDDEGVGAEADMNNLDTFMTVSPIPTTKIHKDHPFEQIIRYLHSTPQTRRMTKSMTGHVEPKKVIQALKDPSWIEAMQDKLLQFKLQQVWTLLDLPYGKRAIGTKWVYRNKKDERGIVIRNKARLVAHGYTQEEGIYCDEVITPVAKIEAIRLFLDYASFKDFVVYQMDVKSA
ncbi:putative ribonuclease H-like domain-containing protein, partial [Tanacetum coccineum]